MTIIKLDQETGVFRRRIPRSEGPEGAGHAETEAQVTAVVRFDE